MLIIIYRLIVLNIESNNGLDEGNLVLFHFNRDYRWVPLLCIKYTRDKEIIEF